MVKVVFVLLLIVKALHTRDFSRGKFSFGMTIKTSKILDMLERHGWTFAPPEDNAEDGQRGQD